MWYYIRVEAAVVYESLSGTEIITNQAAQRVEQTRAILLIKK